MRNSVHDYVEVSAEPTFVNFYTEDGDEVRVNVGSARKAAELVRAIVETLGTWDGWGE